MSDAIGAAVVSKAGSWLRQPTTINGLGALLGALVTGLLHVFVLHDTTLAIVGGAFSTGLVHLVMNDNTASGGGA